MNVCTARSVVDVVGAFFTVKCTNEVTTSYWPQYYGGERLFDQRNGVLGVLQMYREDVELCA